jgi:hypothetical protein
MDEKKALPPTKVRAQTETIYNPILTKHPVRFNSQAFKEKPAKSGKNGGLIHANIHREIKKCDNLLLSIQEILELISRGYCVKLGAFKLQEPTADEIAELRELYREDYQAYEIRKAEIDKAKNLELLGADLLILDVDDRTGATDMQAVFEYSGALALYYSFSHGKISPVFRTVQNSYKLIFALDASITEDDLVKYIQENIKADLYNQFPGLKPIPGIAEGGNNGIDVKGTNFFYGSSINSYLINDTPKVIEIGKHAAEWEAEKELEAYTQKSRQKDKIHSTTDAEILKMAEFLGDTSGLSFDEWRTMAIGIFNGAQTGVISEDTALEVLQILDGYKQKESFYLKYKLPLRNTGKDATIGTFIKLATSRGFKREYPDIKGPEKPTITIQCGRYIEAASIKRIIEDEARAVLLVSPTNSGKTFATLKGCKDYLALHPDTLVYFASPTKALATQVCSSYDLGEPLQGSKTGGKHVKTAIDRGERLIVGTYDKAKQVLNALPPGFKLIVIVDEAHKEVSDYNYRHTAINALFGTLEDTRVIKFMGLTGTPQHIDMNGYDKRFTFKQDQEPDIAEQLLFVTYEEAGRHLNALAETIQKVNQEGKKALVFLNSRDLIEITRKALKKAGIKVMAVTAEKKRKTSPTYHRLLKTGKFADGVDAILATTAISDGISIDNGADYVCIIAPGLNNAPFYNIPLIKQASNRFRNKYNQLIILEYLKPDLEKEKRGDEPFRFEGAYRWLLDSSERTRDRIAEKFAGSLDLYRPSVAENLAGLFNTLLAEGFDFKKAYQERENERLGMPFNRPMAERLDEIEKRLLTVDRRYIRHQTSRDEEKYYQYNPIAFMRAIGEITKIQNVKWLSYTEYMAGIDTSDIEDELKRLKKMALDEAQEKRERVAEILTYPVYEKLKEGYYHNGKIAEDSETWEILKDALHKDHAITLKSVIGFLEYDQAIKELQRVGKRAQTHELAEHLRAVADLEAFAKSGTLEADTQEILGLLADKFDQPGTMVTTSERDIILEGLAKKLRSAKKKQILEKVFKRFYLVGKDKAIKAAGDVFKVRDYRLVTLERIAAVHGFTDQEAKEIYNRFKYTH